MDAETFNLINGILETGHYNDERESATSLMEGGVQEGTIGDVAKVIAGRYCLQPHVVIEWYAEGLYRQVEKTMQLIQKLVKLRIDNVRS